MRRAPRRGIGGLYLSTGPQRDRDDVRSHDYHPIETEPWCEGRLDCADSSDAAAAPGDLKRLAVRMLVVLGWASRRMLPVVVEPGVRLR